MCSVLKVFLVVFRIFLDVLGRFSRDNDLAAASKIVVCPCFKLSLYGDIAVPFLWALE